VPDHEGSGKRYREAHTSLKNMVMSKIWIHDDEVGQEVSTETGSILCLIMRLQEKDTGKLIDP
jgi:hypothetical protein